MVDLVTRIQLKSDGQRQLLEKTAVRGVAAALARACKKEQAFISNWRLKGARPETSNRLVIREFLGIEIEAFDRPPETEFWDEPAEETNADSGPEAA